MYDKNVSSGCTGFFQPSATVLACLIVLGSLVAGCSNDSGGLLRRGTLSDGGYTLPEGYKNDASTTGQSSVVVLPDGGIVLSLDGSVAGGIVLKLVCDT
jgi:hypothetical protein